MPQMSPLMWFSLFILFSMVLILFNQMMFFSFKQNLIEKMKKSMIETKNSHWKW